MFDATVARCGDRLAVVDRDVRRTWPQLSEDVERVASAMRSRGTEAGQVVSFVEGNTVDFVVTFLAAMRLGAVVVPLGPHLTTGELDAHRTAAAGGAGAPDGALVAFSSGSTGRPKAMVRTNANLVAEADQFTAGVGLDETDVVLAVVPLFHAHGLGNCLLASIRSGAALVLGSFERDATLAAIADERVTIFPGVPFVFDALAATRRADPAQLASLRLCFTAGAPLARDSFDTFAARFGHPIRQLYGCSEAGSITLNLDADADATWDCVGRPLPGVDVTVHDIGDDGTGEIAVRSPAATSSYLEPGGAVERFADGWLRPGDLGRIDDDGHLRITGRTTSFISTDVAKVDPFEVEAVLRTHGAVADVVVVGTPGERGAELVKAVVVLRGTPDEAELRTQLVDTCRQQLAAFKIPRIVEFRDEIPRSPLGKILRKHLV